MKYNFIIPYRNRKSHLDEFIKRFSTYVKENSLDAEFYIIHQLHPGPFNRGALLNIGFLEALKLRPDALMIFHDVDLYPTYWGSIKYDTHKNEVRHSIGIPRENIGGICCFWKEEMERVNGFPNYWGWGIEDVTIRRRLEHHHISIDESDIVLLHDTKRCYVPFHDKQVEKENITCIKNTALYHQEVASHNMTNGISSLSYTVYSTWMIEPRFTMINVDFIVKE